MSTRLQLVATVAVLALTLACNSSSNKPVTAQQEGAGSNSLIGAGSTFIYPIMSRWISDFQNSHPGVQINYQSIGSGGGIQQLKQGVVDFGASDASLSDDQLKEMPALLQVPESAGPVCITYNLPELKQPLQLSGATLSGIFLGKIKSWQDAAIRGDNPGVRLPSMAVAVVHRSDGSGTTNIFTTYLAQVNPEWKAQAGQGISIKWPVGIGGKGSEGVTGVVKQTPGAIGYVELNYASQNNLPIATVRNQAGKYVAPTPESTSAAIAAFHDELAKDVRVPIVDPPASAPDAYPISGLTFLMIPKQAKTPDKDKLLKEFVQFVITQGQTYAAELQYAPLPQMLQTQDQNLIAQSPGADPAQPNQ